MLVLVGVDCVEVEIEEGDEEEDDDEDEASRGQNSAAHSVCPS